MTCCSGRPENFRWLPTSAISKATLDDRGEVRRRARPGAASRSLSPPNEGAGVTIHSLEPDPALPYQVFARDSSVDAPRAAPWSPKLAPAVAARRICAGHPLLPREGDPDPGNDHRRFDRGRRRDNRRARRDADRQRRGAHPDPGRRQLASWMEADGWEVRIEAIPGQFVHIDVLVSILAPKLAAVCVEAASGRPGHVAARQGLRDPRGLARGRLRPRSQCDLARRRAGGSRPPARRGWTSSCARSGSRLDPDLSMFTAGGGGAHCLAQALRREPAAA